MSANFAIKMLEYQSIDVCETGANPHNTMFQVFPLHTLSIGMRAASYSHVERGFLLTEDDHIRLPTTLDIKIMGNTKVRTHALALKIFCHTSAACAVNLELPALSSVMMRWSHHQVDIISNSYMSKVQCVLRLVS